MIVQCVTCQKKYRLKAEAVPESGAKVSCSGGCGKALIISPRKNLVADATGIPVTKRKHQKEVKWFGRMAQLLRDWGYEKKTAEYNMLFYFLRELRKRRGITFFDISCATALMRYDRELKYNCLAFMGACCVPPRDGVESCVPDIILALAEALRGHDSAGVFTVDAVMTTPYEDSFPAVFSFVHGAQFAASWGEQVYGSVTEVLISADAVREIPPDFDFSRLHEVARVEVSRAPVDNGRLSFRDKVAPARIVNPEPDPELRCADKELKKLLEGYTA